jgi:prefoldin subunit 5
MFSCARCNSDSSDGPTCGRCKRQFDFPCSGISETNYRKLGARKGTWRCSECVNNPSTINSDPQLAAQLDEMKETLKTITRQLQPLASLVEDMKTVKADISHLKDSVELAHSTVGKVSNDFEGLNNRVKALELEVSNFKKLQDEVAKMHEDMQEKEQWARANNVEIKGIPMKRSENLYELVSRISQVIGCQVRKEDINYIARVPNFHEKSDKNIIMSLNNRFTKENYVAASRGRGSLSLKDIGYQEDGKIYVNDHLTLHNKGLLREAKALAKEKNCKYIWTRHCKILARKTDTSPIFRIKVKQDLLKI